MTKTCIGLLARREECYSCRDRDACVSATARHVGAALHLEAGDRVLLDGQRAEVAEVDGYGVRVLAWRHVSEVDQATEREAYLAGYAARERARARHEQRRGRRGITIRCLAPGLGDPALDRAWLDGWADSHADERAACLLGGFPASQYDDK